MSSSNSTSSAQPASVIIPLLSAYSSLSQTVQGSNNGTFSSITATYTVLYVSPTTYKINIYYVTPTKHGTAVAWFLKDGTVVGLLLVGHNFTTSAGQYFQEYFGLWETELEYEQLITTSASYNYFHSNGTSTVTLGPSTFTVTSYTANSLPETISLCNGESITLTSGHFSVGTPSGSNYPLITYIDAAGSETITGTSATPYDFVSQITSVTVA